MNVKLSFDLKVQAFRLLQSPLLTQLIHKALSELQAHFVCKKEKGFVVKNSKKQTNKQTHTQKKRLSVGVLFVLLC